MCGGTRRTNNPIPLRNDVLPALRPKCLYTRSNLQNSAAGAIPAETGSSLRSPRPPLRPLREIRNETYPEGAPYKILRKIPHPGDV
jgi:hypothetical protein